MQGNIDLSKLVQVHQAIKNARTVRRHAYEEEDAKLEAEEQQLRALMLQILNNTGAKSIATDFGTVYRTEKIKPSAADWSAVYSWVMADPERFELLEKRLKSTFIKQFMDENEGALPPGVNVHREFEVSVRRPTAAKG